MSQPAKQPDRAVSLFELLFDRNEQALTLRLLADGLTTILDHVRELLTDAECLVRSDRFARAWFLASTADEELGKCHLLLDCARLDISKHQSDLRILSRSFYDHVDKYAYMRLWRWGPPTTFWWWSMDDVFRIFNSDRVKFWKATAYSFDEPPDEPDMPHNTYFAREQNLYVDILETGSWYVAEPSDGYARERFDEVNGDFETRKQTTAHLMAFDKLRRQGALGEQALQALNAVWSPHYINRATSREQINTLWLKTATAMSRFCDSTEENLIASPLCFWPCYNALQSRPENL
jgi:AbiV family abortive infection protein